MSHVLDRMLRRARTATPAVVPLYQQRYQPHARAYPGTPAPSEAAESFLEGSPESAEVVAQAPERRGEQLMTIGTISRSAEARSRANAAVNPATLSEPDRLARTFEAATQTLSAVDLDGKPAGPGRPGSHSTSGLRAGIEAREIGARDSADATKREGDRARNARASIPVPESARPSPRKASETAAQNSPEAPLNITISIGHIEVRSPQVLERPRRPSFRPKTSLADFLNPRQGGARE